MRIPLWNNKVFDSVLVCLIFFISFSYFLCGYRYLDLGTYHYDEGIAVYGALRILDGAVPYRDFWTLYNPREFYDDSQRVESLTGAIRYIQDNTKNDEKIFVGNLMHDKAVNSDVMFYFLSERNSATKYYELHPGLTNTRRIQKEIIDDLIKADVQYIILSSEASIINDIDDSNESGKSSGVKDLDNLIQKNYKIEKIFGSYLIFSHV